jgi:hypothetical protein
MTRGFNSPESTDDSVGQLMLPRLDNFSYCAKCPGQDNGECSRIGVSGNSTFSNVIMTSRYYFIETFIFH